ncbi:MAG: hypothetical protein ACK5NN_02865 [Sphingomonadaceae bacterium]
MVKNPPVRQNLRQMLALLEEERQALASLDLEQILGCANTKQHLCLLLEQNSEATLDEECRGLLDAVVRLNATNRKLRNLISANIQSRLDALSGGSVLYSGV